MPSTIACASLAFLTLTFAFVDNDDLLLGVLTGVPTGVERCGAEDEVVWPRAGLARVGGTALGAGARFGGILGLWLVLVDGEVVEG